MADDVKRFYSSKLDAHARAIGHVCIAWGNLEVVIDSLLSKLIPLTNNPVAVVLCHNIDMREKLKIIDGLAFMKQPDNRWFSFLHEAINDIDNLIRPERNRMVHDHWLLREGRVLRQRRQTVLKRPRSFQLEFHLDQLKPIDEDDIWRLVEDIEASKGKLIIGLARLHGADVEKQMREYESRSLHLKK